MSTTDAVKVSQDMLIMVLMIGAPIILSGMIVGLLVSIVQTVTQIQEQSIPFVFKILASILAFFLSAPWMLRKLVDFSAGYLGNLDKFIR